MFILNNFQYPQKISINIKDVITTKILLNTIFENDDNNKKIYKKVLPIQKEINMYIMDYNIDYIIKSINITEPCIDIEIKNDNSSDNMKISNILNNILTKNIYSDIKNREFSVDNIVINLYNDKYNFRSILNGGYKHKYEKYKNKYLNLKNMQKIKS